MSAPSNSALCGGADYKMEICQNSKGDAENLVSTFALIGDGNLNKNQCREIVRPYCEAVDGTVKTGDDDCKNVCFMMGSGALIACDKRDDTCTIEGSIAPVDEILENWRVFFNEALKYMCCDWVKKALMDQCEGYDQAKVDGISSLQIETSANETANFCTTASECIEEAASGWHFGPSRSLLSFLASALLCVSAGLWA